MMLLKRPNMINELISDLVKKSALKAAENKIPDISGLVTTSALTAVENKIPDVVV